MLITKYNWRDARFLFHPDGDNGAPDAPPATPTTPPTDEEPFDKDRAMATIQNLRGFEKQAKALQKQLDELKAAEDERKNKELSEVEKAKKEAEDAKNALKATSERYRTNAIHSAVRLAAVTAGFVDPEDAVKLADLSTVELGDDDKVTGAKEAVDKLAKSKPHLVAPAKPTAPNINAQSGGNPPPLTVDAVIEQKRRSREYVPF